MAASSNRWKQFLDKESFRNAMQPTVKHIDYKSTATSKLKDEEKEGEYKLQFMALELKREVKHLKRSVEDGQKEIDRHKARVKMMSSQLKKKIEDGAVITNENGVEHVIITKEKQEQNESSLKDIQQLWVDSQDECFASKEKISTMESEMDALNNTVSSKEERIKELENNLGNVRKNEETLNETLVNRTEHFHKKQSEFEKITRKLKESLQDKEETMAKLTARQDELQKNEEVLNKTLAKLTEDFNNKQKGFEETITELTENLQNREDILTDLTSQHNGIQQKFYALKNEKDVLEVKVTTLAGETEDNQSTIARLQTDIKLLAVTLEETKEKLQMEEIEKDDYKNQYESLEEKYQKQISKYKSKEERFRRNSAAAQTAIQSLKFKIERIENTNPKPVWKQ